MATKTFEEKMNDLKKILETLESEETTLDESIKLFDKACVLSKECTQLLDNAEQKIITVCEKNEEN